MTPPDADTIIRRLALKPHPEGGWYRETYRARETVADAALPERFDGDRAYSTAIYYLLAGDDISSLHRIPSDEVFHAYLVSALEIIEIAPDGRLRTTRLGRDLAAGDVPQHVVPAGHWFGARLAATAATPSTDRLALVGCTVAPGFDFADFEMGERPVLLARFPDHADVITALTRPG